MQNLVKPQLAFEHKPNNDDNTPWKPLLTSKPHAAVSLEESLGAAAKDAEQHQYDYTTFLPLLILPLSAAALEGLSKSQRRTYNKQVAQLKSISCLSTGLVR
jgi:exosome complex exonuclease RRP6